MSQTTKKLSEKRILGAKVETTAGTAISMSASDAAWWVNDLKLETTVVYNEMESNGTLSRPVGATGSRSGKVTFWIPANGTGTGSSPVPTWASVMFPACAYALTSATFNPVAPNSASATTLTMSFYEDGVVRAIAGAMGTFKMVAEAGKIVRFEFEFQGKLVDDVDTAILAPTYPDPTVAPPLVFQGATNTVGAFGPSASKVTIDFNQTLYLIEDGNDTIAGGTGFNTCIITDRKPMASLDPELRAVATRDWHSKLKNDTLEAFAFKIGGAASNTIAINAAVAQTTKNQRGNRSGIMTNEIDMRFISSSSGGNDEVAIIFS